MNKTIHSEYGSGRRTRILRIELAPKDAKAWAVAQLNGEMEAIRAEYLHKAAASGGRIVQQWRKNWTRFGNKERTG